MRRFTAIGTNVAFTCDACGAAVPPLANGSYRNHCPACLHSRHVDVHPGDRANECGGLLEPIGAEQSGTKGWVVVHRCRRCGEIRRNRAALDDPSVPDDIDVLIELSTRPTPAARRR
ncbi:RNHCP domain-containing protein [soil metagenome]|nr:RNHCP domain-containing protein [Trueperaceae bacterium]